MDVAKRKQTEKRNCLRCGHRWTAKKENPRKCPGCQNPNWNKPRVKQRKPLTFDIEVREMVEDIAEELPAVAKAQIYGTLTSAKARAEELLRRLA